MKRVLAVLSILFFISIAIPVSAESRGVLSGRNLYLPYLPFYSFPGTQTQNRETSWEWEEKWYWVNDISIWALPPGGATMLSQVSNPDYYLHLDYESLILEERVFWNNGSNGQWSATLRLIGYFNGMGDPLIEGFHSLFGFPNAGREYYPKNRLYIDYKGTNGYDGKLQSSLISLGDVDITYRHPLWFSDHWVLYSSAALKIPTFIHPGLTGSSHPDLGIQLAMTGGSEPIFWHIQSGLVYPFTMFTNDTDAYKCSSQNILALEYAFSSNWSLLIQGNINSSFIDSPYSRYTFFGEIPLYSSLQTNVRIGVKRDFSKGSFQFYFEEDPLTNDGSDLILNLSYSIGFF